MKIFFRYALEHDHWEACQARPNLYPLIIVALTKKEDCLSYLERHHAGFVVTDEFAGEAA